MVKGGLCEKSEWMFFEVTGDKAWKSKVSELFPGNQAEAQLFRKRLIKLQVNKAPGYFLVCKLLRIMIGDRNNISFKPAAINLSDCLH